MMTMVITPPQSSSETLNCVQGAVLYHSQAEQESKFHSYGIHDLIELCALVMFQHPAVNGFPLIGPPTQRARPSNTMRRPHVTCHMRCSHWCWDMLGMHWCTRHTSHGETMMLDHFPLNVPTCTGTHDTYLHAHDNLPSYETFIPCYARFRHTMPTPKPVSFLFSTVMLVLCEPV